MTDLVNGYFINKTKKELEARITSVFNELVEEFNQEIGGYKKYAKPGTYTFVVPTGITNILVSAIGAGGGGGGGGGGKQYGSSTTYYAPGSAGGGGGYGNFSVDQSIAVTPGETLTVIIGAGGTGGTGGVGGSSAANGTKGSTGETTYLKRGNTVLLSVTGGTGGEYGSKNKISSGTTAGGIGGITAGEQGGSAVEYSSNWSASDKYGIGGAGGTHPIFRLCGAGGNGGNGGSGSGTSSTSTNKGKNGDDGAAGAIGIAFGIDMDCSSIPW